MVVLAGQLIQQEILRRLAGFQLLTVWQQGLLTGVVMRGFSPLLVTLNRTVNVSPSGALVVNFHLPLMFKQLTGHIHC